MSSLHSPHFYYAELTRALAEQFFGISSFTVNPPTSPLEATAVVNLLEGMTINISLTSQGYQIGDGRVYESIEDLLQSESSMYEFKRQEALMIKLSNLS